MATATIVVTTMLVFVIQYNHGVIAMGLTMVTH